MLFDVCVRLSDVRNLTLLDSISIVKWESRWPSALDSGLNGPGSSPHPGRGSALCSWARYFTLIVPLSTQVYKWVPANLLHPIQGGVETLLVASCYGNWDKLRPDGPLGSYTDFTWYSNTNATRIPSVVSIRVRTCSECVKINYTY